MPYGILILKFVIISCNFNINLIKYELFSMKFGLYLEQNSVSEWRDFYINYRVLKRFLKLFEEKYKRNSK